MSNQTTPTEQTGDTIQTLQERSYTSLQRHFLLRLGQLVTLHSRVDTWPTQDELARLLVGGALYSTIQDCKEAGVGDMAALIIQAGVSPEFSSES